MRLLARRLTHNFRGRRRFVWLVSGLVLLVAAAWATGAVSQATLALAAQALARRDDAAAVRWIGVTQSLDPNNGRAEAMLARLDRREERFDEADAHLRKARALGLDQQSVRREEMLARAQAGSLEGIEGDLNEWLAVADAADRREICEAYANGLAIQARFGDANRLLEAWRLDFPNDPQPEYRMARIYEHLRQKSEAEEHYRAALAKDAEYYPAAYSLGRILLDRKDAEEALAQYRKCAALPYPAAAHVGMGTCLKALGKTDEARELFRQAATASEADRIASYKAVGEPTARFVAAIELGKLETEAGNYDEAERWLKKAVDADPRDSVARYAWAVALRGSGKQQEAEKQFELVRVARVALDEAGKLHDRIDQHPEDVDARYRLGVILLEHDSEKAGLFWLNTALSYDPHHAATHRALAEYFGMQADEHPDAERLAEMHRSLAEKYATKP